MIDLIRDPYVIAAMGSIISGLLILKGAGLIQDGKNITGYAHIVVALYALWVTWMLGTSAMNLILKGPLV